MGTKGRSRRPPAPQGPLGQGPTQDLSVLVVRDYAGCLLARAVQHRLLLLLLLLLLPLLLDLLLLLQLLLLLRLLLLLLLLILRLAMR